MPKAKPSQVIVHRIELQQSERDMLEMAVAGNVATNAITAAGAVITGIGNMLRPFDRVLEALVVLWIGDRALDAVRADGEARKAEFEAEYAENKFGYDQMICAWLTMKYADGGWDAVCSEESRIELHEGQFQYLNPERGGMPKPIPLWYFHELLKFLDVICASANARQSTPATLWQQWMTEEQYGQAAYYDDTNGSVWEGFKRGVGSLFD